MPCSIGALWSKTVALGQLSQKMPVQILYWVSWNLMRVLSAKYFWKVRIMRVIVKELGQIIKYFYSGDHSFSPVFVNICAFDIIDDLQYGCLWVKTRSLWQLWEKSLVYSYTPARWTNPALMLFQHFYCDLCWNAFRLNWIMYLVQ